MNILPAAKDIALSPFCYMELRLFVMDEHVFVMSKHLMDKQQQLFDNRNIFRIANSILPHPV